MTTEIAGNLAERPLLDVVRALHAQGASGVLEIDPAGQRRRLFFRDGELHLAGNHPLARMLAEQVADLRTAQAAGGVGDPADLGARRRRLLELVDRIVTVVLEWRQGPFRFVAGAALPADLVGPLPTRRLLMLGSTRGADESELLRRLGGEACRLACAGDPAGPDLLGLSPEEAFLLERLRLPMTLGELMRESPVGRLDLLQRLAQLAAVGLVAAATEERGAAATTAATDAEVLTRLSERVARSLAEEPIDLPAEVHRAQLTDLLARAGGLNHYELLEVSTSAGAEEVHAAYERRGRLVHPANALRLGLEGGAEALRYLFERATQAYVTLSDPERRRVYNLTQAVELSAAPPSDAAREEERRDLARRHYDKAMAYAAATEFHFAIELLEQAVRIDPRPTYWMALAKLQSRNPNWLRRAVDSYRAAIELDADNVECRVALGHLFEQLADPDRARVQYAAAVRLDPHHLEAQNRLAKLLAGRPERPGGSLFDRIFRRG